MRNVEKEQTVASYPSSICHIFSPPLKVSMLRKIRCRIRSQTLTYNHNTIPLSIALSKQQLVAHSLNESQNCAETLPYECTSSIIHGKQYPSLIAIDIGNDELPQEQTTFTYVKQSMDFCFPIDKSEVNNKIRSNRRSLIKLDSSNSCVSICSHCDHHHRNQIYRCLSLSIPSIRKRKNDSIIFAHQHRYPIDRLNYLLFKQRSLSDYSSQNINSITYDSPLLTDQTINLSKSNSDIFIPTNKKVDKTWRLKIQDHLNKDGSRHFVMHKGSEESVRERRQKKRTKRSEEKKRKIEEKVNKANQRWQKYSNIDYELVFFISRYYDQLPLCSNCRNYFTTHQTQFLADDPRASLDYAAEAILHSPNDKTLTLKKAAKARLIKDYDKQTNIIFNLCDTCLIKCEEIRNELKQINDAQKLSNELNPLNPSMMTMTTSDLQQHIIVPPSSNILNIDNQPYSSSTPPFVSPSTWNTNLNYQQKITSPSHQNIITDLNQLYVNNIIQYHQIKLQQLYQQSQNIIIAQQHQENYPLTIDQQQLHHDLQLCIRQMQYHCLEILHLQYPGSSLSFPYTPSYNSKYLSYRSQQIDNESIDSENSSSISEKDNDKRRSVTIEDESDTSTTTITSDDNRCRTDEYDGNQQSIDDRLTIETYHGLVEYYSKLTN
ncbi:unnamed protein product [Rotaria sordida]|uniref:Uncharacterized protein n=1 Tax=Rotaria sordida TaxID=392033 RepID=A0A818QQU7_9BILA|nr:unnamed protein product [Rotaria sordida]CAF0860775.1 unnamed protein product [Rotaria sordida]CAF3638282.1 unnamed protein product [Rotaria sordida]CAF3807183.1 unnamed protein product [Rotaria sordida]